MISWHCDVIFAGGGLASTLSAYRLRQLRPELRILIVESGETLGGNHTWSFHDHDITQDAQEWIAPFVSHSWPSQEVRFPKHARFLSSGYNTIFSHGLHRAAMTLLEDCAMFSAPCVAVAPDRVALANGDEVTASCVIDCRGLSRLDGLTLAYQKFVGIEVEFEEAHGQPHPIIMDATVPQRDGYRFVYTLPFDGKRMLIEDTYYSDTPLMDIPKLTKLCLDYAQTRGWTVARTLRTETGVLPIVLSGDSAGLARSRAPGLPALGLRGGFFHHTTTYSFPFAVRCAEWIAAFAPLTSAALSQAMERWAEEHWRTQRFFRLLNRMLFWAAKPDQRYRVLERFYELREPLIERFYNSTLTASDQARILVGWPPVPIGRALRVLAETRTNPMAEASAP